jgi:uncharacterized protein
VKLLVSARSLITPLLWIAAVLLVLFVLVRLVEASVAFYPFRGESVTPGSENVPYDVHAVTTSDGETLRLWHLRREQPQAQVVYFHGNGGNLSVWADVFTELWRRGVDVIAVDYRGYGLSSGRPSERGLYRDVDATLSLVESRLRDSRAPLVYWGRSLGATFAAYAASRHPPAGVVLEAAFPDARAVLETSPLMWALSWFSSYRFPTARWMSRVACPVLVIHGDRDSVIRYSMGQRLFARLREPKSFVTIAGGDHNDPAPSDPKVYWTPIQQFFDTLAERQR